jgi:hypothetical protein
MDDIHPFEMGHLSTRTHSLVTLRLRPWSSVGSVQFLRTLLQASNSIYESITHIDERQTNSKSFAAD